MSSRETARRFHFLREIATGGFGSVYLAKVMHADGFSRLVAVKLLKAQWSDNDEVTRRIRDEARLLGLLRHRNIVDVIDLTSIDGRSAVVMEYLEAVDFRTVSMHLHDTGGAMSPRAAIEAMSYVASALDAAYNRPPIPGDKPLRVIHRDIKPSNIMVDETGMVKVLDFGVARSEIENRESHTQELQFGSIDYMAPERLFFEPETPASDVYSLGASLFEILALEKLGKARGRPEKHAAFLDERLVFLHQGNTLQPDEAISLEALLRDALDFAHERRPSAAEFFQRARALYRSLPGDDLGQWAEKVIPPLVRTAHETPKEANTLADSTLPEDSVAIDRIFGQDTEAMIQTGIRNVVGQLGIPNLAQTSVGDQLRRGALAELDESVARGFAPSPATGGTGRAIASLPRFSDAPDPVTLHTDVAVVVQPDDPGDWPDVPTHMSEVATPTAADPLDEPTQLAPAVLLEEFDPPGRTLQSMDEPVDAAEVPDAGALDAPDAANLQVWERAATTVFPSLSRSRPEEPPPLPVFPPVPQGAAFPDDDDSVPRAGSTLLAPPPMNRSALSVPQAAALIARPSPPPPAAQPAQPVQETRTQPPVAPAKETRTLPPVASVAPVAPVKESRTFPPPQASQPVARPTPPSKVEVEIDDGASEDGDAPPPKSRGLLPYLFVGAFLFSMVGVVGAGAVAYVLDLGGMRERLHGGSDAPAVAAAPSAPTAAPGGDDPPEPSGPALRFVSDAAGTQRMSAECNGGADKRKGASAVVGLDHADQCMITAVLEDRSRLRATVTGATAGTYRCFAGGKEACSRP